ncbi:haloacid dehalogenase-like hydrolase [Actinocrinis puniceicyclus]|uniref:Haloacid dehalogenase-like hydrolase n=1 Tax=Actinocrinis puniceicyclus TaxID=977794 RepID=A0A8J8BC06_9ACTN|nr:haloacid dehalogenase-like hydrolase [Actinocrinis puniceicyclus]MBS2964612.1 haloacid dehalogenase-like hydrolase [Actinocrinis puniceicyclus]
MPEAPLLVLWDIDHTLVAITGVGRELYALAFERVTGQPLVHMADMAGRTEQAIIRETLALNSVESAVAFEVFYAALVDAARSLEARFRERGRVLPGARTAMAAFRAGGAVQSLVTGNLPSIAAAKLEAFGLEALVDFEVGGYGDDGSDRAVLVRLAVERSGAKYGHAFKAEHAVVIGDTPHDVRGALEAGAVAVGVATGASDADALAAAGAHVVLPDLRDLAALHEVLLARRAA